MLKAPASYTTRAGSRSARLRHVGRVHFQAAQLATPAGFGDSAGDFHRAFDLVAVGLERHSMLRLVARGIHVCARELQARDLDLLRRDLHLARGVER